MINKGMSSRRDSEGVSPVIATILLVAITVVLAATLYYMVIGFGGDSVSTIPPVGDFVMEGVPHGMKFTFTPFSRDIFWGDISIVISDGTNLTSFKNITTSALHTGEPVTASYGSQPFTSFTVFMNATDFTGNGYINGGDSFTLTSGGGNFANNITYEVSVIYTPSGAKIVSDTFQGE